MSSLRVRPTLVLAILCSASAVHAEEAPPHAEPAEAAPGSEASPVEEAPPAPETPEAHGEEPPPLYGSAAGEEEAPPVYESAPARAEATPPAYDASKALEEAERAAAGPFARHRVRVGGLIGFAGGATTEWLVLGAGVGYFVLDGLELHADGTLWLIGSPFVATVSPGVRYVFHQLPQIKPYVGAFYQHYFVDRAGFDTDSLGGRLGLYFPLSERSYFGGGIVYERFLDGNLFRDRDQLYPEIVFAFSF